MRTGRVLTDAEIDTMRAELADVTTPPPPDRPWWDVFNISATIDLLKQEIKEAREEEVTMQRELDGWKKRCHDELRLQVKYRNMWEKAESDLRDQRRRREEDLAALLRTSDLLCDWQTRAINAERKLKRLTDPQTFAEAMLYQAEAGSLTESMAREWLEGADLEKALAIIASR